jgi:hypothetical protein
MTAFITPLSTPFWPYAQVFQLFVFSVAFHASNVFDNKLRVVKTGVVEAFRDVLAPYAAGTYNCLDLLPLLRLIEELWDAANDEVALSVRCVTGFIVTPPVSVLETFLPDGVQFIGRDTPGSDFLSRRLFA